MKDTAKDARVPAIDRRDFVKLGVGAAGAGAMMAMGAPGAWAQNGANRPVSIDLHNHWRPLAYTKALEQLGGPKSADGAEPRNFDLQKRIAWMDAHGVQMHVLTLNGGMPWQWAPPDLGDRLAQIVNDAAIEAHMAYPTRFMAGAEVSIRDPKLALNELNRVAGKPGIRAVHLPNSIEGRDYLFEPAYGPFLARCEELQYPLIFHPLDGDVNRYAGASRLADQIANSGGLANTLGFPFEHTTTAAKFLVSGTLDKYPRLQIVLGHSGGAFPYITGRLHHGLAGRQGLLKRPMIEYIRQFHYDSLTYMPETLRFLIGLVGSDRVVIGTDNFAGMDVEYPNALTESLKLPPEDMDRILRGNAARLLQI